jgi:hypothetical protein
MVCSVAAVAVLRRPREQVGEPESWPYWGVVQAQGGW